MLDSSARSLKDREIDSPAIQQGHDDLVLIKVLHASVNTFDYLFRRWYFPVRPSTVLLS